MEKIFKDTEAKCIAKITSRSGFLGSDLGTRPLDVGLVSLRAIYRRTSVWQISNSNYPQYVPSTRPGKSGY